jgi:hypothetical protein
MTAEKWQLLAVRAGRFRYDPGGTSRGQSRLHNKTFCYCCRWEMRGRLSAPQVPPQGEAISSPALASLAILPFGFGEVESDTLSRPITARADLVG